MKRKAIIFDLDNCVSNDRARIGRIDWSKEDPNERYAPYHEGCGEDPIHWNNFWSGVRQWDGDGTDIPALLFITARPEEYRPQTEKWLEPLISAVGVGSCLLVMRRTGCKVGSVQLKEQAARELRAAYDIVGAFDDREDIVKMYNRIGIPARTLKCHDVCAMTPPAAKEHPAIAQAKEDWKVAEAWDDLMYGGAEPAPPRTAADILDEGAATYRERNKLYGDNYKHFGHVMTAIFPQGLTLATPEAWNRLGIFVQCAAKFTRYAQNFNAGGHLDSAHDLSVYAAMLQELTELAEKEKETDNGKI